MECLMSIENEKKTELQNKFIPLRKYLLDFLSSFTQLNYLMSIPLQQVILDITNLFSFALK